MSKQIYFATGQLIDRDSGQGVAGAMLEAWDINPQVTKVLGRGETDENGRFSMMIDLTQFHYVTAPDLFFKVFVNGVLVESTESSVLWNSNTQESVTIKIRTARNRPAGKDRITSSQVFKGIDFIQKSDFKGVISDYRSKLGTSMGFLADMVSNTFSTMDLEPVRVKDVREEEVINQDIAVSKAKLESKNISVNEVLPYEPGLNTDSIKNISIVERLKPGQKVNLYQKDGKVRNYSIIKPEQNTKELSAEVSSHAVELTKLNKELELTRESSLEKDEKISLLQNELAELRKANNENDEKKEKQISSLESELEGVRKDQKEIRAILKSDNFNKFIEEINKPKSGSGVKKSTKPPGNK